MIVSTSHLASLLAMPWREIERIADRAGTFYSPFDRRRKRGEGKWRHIDNPKDALKALQSRIYRRVLLPFELPDSITGGVPGRSARDHAARHVGKPVLVTLDLRACFPNIDYHAINEVYRRLGYSPTIARVLTKLTSFQGSLPQGAPSSSALANLALLDLHRELRDLASDLDLALTFYVDDIAISGARAREAVDPAILAIMRHGHRASRDKVVVAHAGVQQRVTGTVVNSARSIDWKYRQQLYALIHEVASAECPRDYQIKSVLAKIAHVERISATQGAVLRALAGRLLPEDGIEGRKPRTDETRPCRHRRRHRTRSPRVTMDSSSSVRPLPA